jgi:hypothetical protein
MSVLAPQERRSGSTPSRQVKPRRAFTLHEKQAAVAHAGSDTHRWFLFLGIPFVLGFTFFGLAIALGAEWPMIPTFFFGPFLLVIAYIVLCLTSDANNTTSD